MAVQDTTIDPDDCLRIANAAGLGFITANNLFNALTAASADILGAPYVDLRLAPYGVTTGAAAATANMNAIKSAIATYNGTGAVLQLPAGDVYVERDTAGQGIQSIRFAPGTSKLTLKGQGMFATRLIMQGVGVSNAEWNLIVVDSSTDITISDMTVLHGTIDNPDFPGDHHALIQVVAATADCRNVVVERVYFSDCIGDAYRVLGDGTIGYKCENLKLLNFVMDTRDHPLGASGLGAGSRSGVSFQRGVKNVEIGHGYIRGAKNSPFEMEPSGVGIQDNILIHDLVVDNSQGSTRLAFTVAGTITDPMKNLVISNVVVVNGSAQIVHTAQKAVTNFTIHVKSDAPAELADDSLLFLHQDNNDAIFSNLTLHRDTGAPAGPLITIIPTGQATGTITPCAGSLLIDGETFTVSDGVTAKVFEFDSGGGVTGGRVAVAFTGADTETTVRDTILAAVNGAGFNVTAEITTVVGRPAVLLTNKHHGTHGNVPITDTVANVTFLVEGMANGVGGSNNIQFRGGNWISRTTAGSAFKYIDCSGCDRITFEGINLELWAATTSEYGFAFRSVGDVNRPSIVDCRVDSRSTTFGATGAKLAAAASFSATNAYQVRDIYVSGLRAPNSCTTGILFDNQGGGGMDSTPTMLACDFTGATNVWLAQNSAANTVFPMISGNKGGVCTRVGTVAPEGVVTAPQGSQYVYQNGNSTALYFKSTGTGNTGWSQVTIP